MARLVIDDRMWSRLQPLLPAPKGRHGDDDRMFLEAVCWVVRTGSPPASAGRMVRHSRLARYAAGVRAVEDGL